MQQRYPFIFNIQAKQAYNRKKAEIEDRAKREEEHLGSMSIQEICSQLVQWMDPSDANILKVLLSFYFRPFLDLEEN